MQGNAGERSKHKRRTSGQAQVAKLHQRYQRTAEVQRYCICSQVSSQASQACYQQILTSTLQALFGLSSNAQPYARRPLKLSEDAEVARIAANLIEKWKATLTQQKRQI